MARQTFRQAYEELMGRFLVRGSLYDVWYVKRGKRRLRRAHLRYEGMAFQGPQFSDPTGRLQVGGEITIVDVIGPMEERA